MNFIRFQDTKGKLEHVKKMLDQCPTEGMQHAMIRILAEERFNTEYDPAAFELAFGGEFVAVSKDHIQQLWSYVFPSVEDLNMKPVPEVSVKALSQQYRVEPEIRYNGTPVWTLYLPGWPGTYLGRREQKWT